MGMFDDLIPERPPSRGGGGMFDDLIPTTDSPVDVSGSIASGQIRRARAAPIARSAESTPEGGLEVVPGAEGMQFPEPRGPSATARRMREGAAAGFGDRPLGINPEDRAKYPIARALQPIAAPVDFLGRLAAGTAYGGAGAVAGLYEDLGGSPADANRLQRDLGVVAQYPVTEASLATKLPQVAENAASRLPREMPRAEAELAAREPVLVRPENAAPPAGPMATSRGDTGVRLLPPEVPHAPAVRPSREDQALGADAGAMREGLSGGLAGRRSAGAAGTPGTGPLSEISPTAIDKLKTMFAEEGFTPDTLEQRLAEMSNHEFLGEISPNTALSMSGLNGTGGAARNEITNSVRQRSREAGERMEAAFDRAFGSSENRFQLQKVMEISRDQQVQPFWQRFREMTVEPTPQINALLPRLEAAGALQAANRALAVEGLPSQMGFQRLGTGAYIRDTPQFVSALPAVREEVPTAAAFQAAKEHLDDLIEKSMENPGGANDARRYTALKNDLVNALDRHPDPEVAGVWQRARDEYATPTSIIKAMKVGERALTGNVTAEELPFLTASYSPAELRAFNIGMRGRLEDIAGRPGRTENTLINTILARSNQSKIRWAVGDERAGELIAAIEHEQRMHNAPNSLIYNSMTQPREEAAKFWSPQPGLADKFTINGAAHALNHLPGTLVKGAADVWLGRRAEKKAADFARVREEASRIMTLQGPERDAVARELVGGGEGPAAPAAPRTSPRPPSAGPAPQGQAAPTALERVDAPRASLSAAASEPVPPHEGARIVEHGPNGPVADGYQGRWAEAVDWLRRSQTGDARGVLTHPQIGAPIDVIWGNSRYGLEHIFDLHPEVVPDLPERLARMTIDHIHDEGKPSARIVLGNRARGEWAVLRNYFDGEKKTWLLTAFQGPGPGSGFRRGERPGGPPGLKPAADLRSSLSRHYDEEGAGQGSVGAPEGGVQTDAEAGRTPRRAAGGRTRRARFAGGGTTARNRPYVTDAPKDIRQLAPDYRTKLKPLEEMAFRQWAVGNKVPFDPKAATADYDMRGFYRALQQGDPRAVTAVNPNDGRMHYPDTWKTPSHESFSAGSDYAGDVAPQWASDDKLISPDGRILVNERAPVDERTPRFAAGGRVNARNIARAPTEAQKKAGNYAKDRGVDRGGKTWSVKMPAHYGYFKGTLGRDKDQVDVYLGPHLKSPKAFVVDQVDAESRKFDEHKVFLGFGSATQVRHTYLKAFSDGRGRARLGHLTEMTVAELKAWLAKGDTTKPLQAARAAA